MFTFLFWRLFCCIHVLVFFFVTVLSVADGLHHTLCAQEKYGRAPFSSTTPANPRSTRTTSIFKMNIRV